MAHAATSSSPLIRAIENEFRKTKGLAEGAFSQLADGDFFYRLNPEQNSIAVIVRHLAGNMLSRFTEDLSDLTNAIRNDDGDALFKKFESSRKTRREIIKMGQDSAAPDFGREHHKKKPSAIPAPYSTDLD